VNHDHKISVFNHAKAARPSCEISLEALYREVKDGAHRAQIEVLRAEQNEPKQKLLKDELKGVSLSGKVTSGGRRKGMQEGRFAHSGYLQIDLDADDLQGQSPADVRDLLGEDDPHIITAFISPRGNGVKAVMLVPPAATEEEHKATFANAERYMLDTYGLPIDKSTKDPVRLCFLSYDPDARWNEDAVQLATAAPRAAAAPAKPSTTSSSLKLGLNAIIPQPPYKGIHDWMIKGVRKCEQHGMSEADTFAKFKAYDGTLRRPFDHNELENVCREIFDTPSATSTTSAGTKAAVNASDLLARAYAMAYNPDETPPPDEACMVIGDIAVAARGNLTALQGKSKVGKSAVVSAILGAAQRGQYAVKGDTLRFEWEGLAEGAIIHLDTEQSRADWHGLVTRSIHRAGMPAVSDRLVSLPLVMFARSERLMILEGALAKEADRHGRIDAVIIDGIADLCTSPNDEKESLELVSQIHALAQKYECPIFAILHENPSSDQGKTRGHLGSELNRKAFANLRIDKDTETSISTIYGTDMRKRDLPKEQGFCFAWDKEAEMHLFQGRAAGLKAAQREEKQVAKERDYFTPLFESIGTNGTCPDSSPDGILEAHRDIIGTEKIPTRDAIRKRMQRAESLGVLRKNSRETWSLTATGQSGQYRDK